MRIVWSAERERFESREASDMRAPYHWPRKLKESGFQFDSKHAIWFTRSVVAVRKIRGAEIDERTNHIINVFLSVMSETKALPQPKPIILYRNRKSVWRDVAMALCFEGVFSERETRAAVGLAIRRGVHEEFNVLYDSALAILRKATCDVPA